MTNYQGSTVNELRAMARNQAMYFQYGTNTPGATIFAKVNEARQYLMDLVSSGLGGGKSEAQKAADSAKEGATQAKNRAGETAQKAGDRAKEEL